MACGAGLGLLLGLWLLRGLHGRRGSGLGLVLALGHGVGHLAALRRALGLLAGLLEGQAVDGLVLHGSEAVGNHRREGRVGRLSGLHGGRRLKILALIGVDAQLLSLAHLLAYLVGLADGRGGDAILLGDRGEGLAAAHGVPLHHKFLNILSAAVGARASRCRLHHSAAGIALGVVVEDAVLVGQIGIHLQRGEHQRVGAYVAGNQACAILRIERLQLLHGDAQHVAYLLEMHPSAHMDRVREYRLAGQGGRYVVEVVVVEGVVGGDECGHIAAGLRGQVGVDLPEVFLHRLAASGAANGLVDVARAAVVGGDGQRPVAVDVVELLQIAGGGVGRGYGVAALVDERAHFQALARGRREHELPQPRGSGARHGVGVQGRFDHRQVLELQRQAILVEGLLEDGHIVEAHSQNVLHQLLLAVDIHLYVGAHHRVVGQLDHRGQLAEALDVFLVGNVDRGLRVGLAVDVGVVAQIPVVLHQVDVGLEALGIHDGGVVEAVAYLEYGKGSGRGPRRAEGEGQGGCEGS